MVQIYTSFGYDGVGTVRRIKDELAKELTLEGRTWSQVVDGAVGSLSWKGEVGQKVEKSSSEGASTLSISQLIKEAKELDQLLDQLGRKMSRKDISD